MKRTDLKTQHNTRNHHAGFSLIEILVVIALIVLLTGMVVGVGRRLRQSAHVSQTKIILGVCKAAADEYATKFKPVLHYNGTLEPSIKSDYIYEDNWNSTNFKQNADGFTGTGKIDDHIERFVYKAMKYEVSRKILTTLKGQLIDKDGDGFLEVIDGFGNMIDYAAYVSHQDNYKGTYHNPSETTAPQGDDALPIRKTSYFASAGRDGVWGNAQSSTDTDSDGDNDIDDNQYSYDQD